MSHIAFTNNNCIIVTYISYLLSICRLLIVLFLANGELESRGHLAGKFTAMARSSEATRPGEQINVTAAAAECNLLVEADSNKQLLVKKVGELTVVLLTQAA
jgi:hypothetical protein